MRFAPYQPKIHFLVCANRRGPESPLGPGCGERGEAVFVALKAKVAAARAYQAVWVTQTACLGVCPKSGATVARYRAGDAAGERAPCVLTEVTPDDVDRLYDEAT